MACPPNLVLFVLGYEANAFQDIGNIVDPPLLYLKLGDCLIEVNTLFWCVLNELDELLGQLDKTVFLPRPLT